MVRRTIVALGVGFAALVALPVLADEIVHFTNGTALPIRSHRVEKDMITVDLGSDARMSFPAYMVDKIESSGRQVYLNPTYHPTNQAVAGSSRPDVTRGETMQAPAIDTSVSSSGSTAARRRADPRGAPVAPGAFVSNANSVDASPAKARVNSSMARLRPLGNRKSYTESGSGEGMVSPNGNVILPPDPSDPATRRAGAVRLSPRADNPASTGSSDTSDESAPATVTPSSDAPAADPGQDTPPSDPPSSD